MRSQLASFTQQLSNIDWIVTVSTGGNLTGGTIYLYIQLLNRVGRNLLSQSKVIVYETGDRITVTINESVVVNGEDLWAIVISGERTGNIEDAVQLAIIDYRLADGFSTIALPTSIDLTEDAHLETENLVVAAANDLPSGNDLINGQVREVSEEEKIYRYDETIDSWMNHFFDSFYSYISNTKEEGGSDQELGADLIFSPQSISGDSSPITTTPIRYWLIGNEDEADGQTINGSFNLRIAVNGATVSETGTIWGNVFASLFKFQLVGYYRLLNRAIDTGMDEVGVTQTWHPTYNLLKLPLNLPAGYAAVFDLWLEADLQDLSSAGFEDGDVLTIGFDRLGKVGIPSDISALTGDVVFGEGEKLLVLPNKILSGKAIAGGFFFDSPNTQNGIFNSIAANTPNQVVIINGATGGTVRTSVAPANLLSSEVVRCTFSTEPGFTNPSEFSEIFILSSTGGLTVTINHPVGGNLKAFIRGDYSDKAIAGNNQADWDNPNLRLYLLQGSTLFEKNTLITSSASATQTEEILNLDDFTRVDFISNARAIFGDDFSLFAPQQPSVTELAGGVLQPNTYQVAIRYEYPAPNNLITRLRHDVEGVIKTLSQTFEDLLSTYNRWSNTVISIAQARELDNSLRIPLSVWLISDFGYAPYLLRLDISSPDDGRNVIRFNQGLGGFIPLKTLGLRFGTNTELFDSYSLIRVGSGLIAQEDVAGRAIAIRLDEEAIAPLETRFNLIDEKGNILLGDNSSLIVAP